MRWFPLVAREEFTWKRFLKVPVLYLASWLPGLRSEFASLWFKTYKSQSSIETVCIAFGLLCAYCIYIQCILYIYIGLRGEVDVWVALGENPSLSCLVIWLWEAYGMQWKGAWLKILRNYTLSFTKQPSADWTQIVRSGVMGVLGAGVNSFQILCAFRSCGVNSAEFSVSKAASLIGVTSFAE